MKTFWDKEIIIGQSPMDGVTDAAYRYIVDIYGKPDLLFTEFVPVEGLARGAVRILQSFIHHPSETPTLAQIYGTNLDAYYAAGIIAAELGFDGVDINMGCPDRAVARKGAGAGLIRTPKLAQNIITTVKKAVKDWSEGQTMEKSGVHEEILKKVNEYQQFYKIKGERKIIPVSVKTRIGYEDIVTEEWIKNICEMQPSGLSLHGRTLAQMYTGKANWEEIGKAANIARSFNIPLLGNGDITSIEDAKNKIASYKLSGALIGRASFGNPWIFQDCEVNTQLRLQTALEHAEVFAKLLPEGHFISLRKHMAWYCKGFDNAAEVRDKLMHINSVEDVRKILNDLLLQN